MTPAPRPTMFDIVNRDRARGFALGALLCLLAVPWLSAVSATLTLSDIERALAIARSSDAARAAFDDRYRFPLNDPTVKQLEVITEFRRAVLAGEERVQFGDYMFGVREARERIRQWQGRLTIVAHLRFHPQNVYVSVPAFDVSVLAADGSVQPLAITRTPIYQSSPVNAPVVGGPILGATIEAVFEAAPLARAAGPVIVGLDGKEIARATIDFAGLE